VVLVRLLVFLLWLCCYCWWCYVAVLSAWLLAHTMSDVANSMVIHLDDMSTAFAPPPSSSSSSHHPHAIGQSDTRILLESPIDGLIHSSRHHRHHHHNNSGGGSGGYTSQVHHHPRDVDSRNLSNDMLHTSSTSNTYNFFPPIRLNPDSTTSDIGVDSGRSRSANNACKVIDFCGGVGGGDDDDDDDDTHDSSMMSVALSTCNSADTPATPNATSPSTSTSSTVLPRIASPNLHHYHQHNNNNADYHRQSIEYSHSICMYLPFLLSPLFDSICSTLGLDWIGLDWTDWLVDVLMCWCSTTYWQANAFAITITNIDSVVD
jgi:hypothetical protein